ncbi:hypothetical protein ACFFP0_20425 [Rhizobium puerariae]|uniref:Uncharacterized protein n=1 Tax=Rhizobium puerariae TaxID=1585791 RepID=A0ABV6APH5_9HYPH
MTTIGSTSYFSALQRYTGADRTKSGADSADRTAQPAASSSQTQSARLTSLLKEAEDLQKKQARMSNRDYLLASFTLQEQIAGERLKAGEDLDTIRVQFEGRTFNLAGKILDTASLEFTKVSGTEKVQLARPRSFTI